MLGVCVEGSRWRFTGDVSKEGLRIGRKLRGWNLLRLGFLEYCYERIRKDMKAIRKRVRLLGFNYFIKYS